MLISALTAVSYIRHASLKCFGSNMKLKTLLPANCAANRTYSMVPGENNESGDKTTVTVLNKESDVILIDSFSEAGFRINTGYFVFGPMVVFPKSVLQWNVKDASTLDESSFSILKILCPAIDVVVISLGDTDPVARANVSKILLSQKVSFEILPTFQACATFNFMNSEYRHVAGFFIPPKICSAETQKAMKSEQVRRLLLQEDTRVTEFLSKDEKSGKE